jgi:hypothetical protein
MISLEEVIQTEKKLVDSGFDEEHIINIKVAYLEKYGFLADDEAETINKFYKEYLTHLKELIKVKL